MFRNLSETQLIEKSNELRFMILQMLCEAKSGHSGGSLSSIDILAVLYNNIMNINPQNPHDPNRDRFVLSKGHCCPAQYAVLADCGYFDKAELKTLRKFGSLLQGHPSMKSTPGIEVSTGSLGQGLSIAVGMALAAKSDGTGQRFYCLMGDGEQQEGQIWEAAMCASHYHLDNLCGIVDHNNLQIDGEVSKVMNIEPLTDKWRAFGWNTVEIDGHNMAQITQAFHEAKEWKGTPTVIIAHTIKGKGISFMENKASWHGVAPNKEQFDNAAKELGF